MAADARPARAEAAALGEEQEDEEDLGAIGFMFDAETIKTWVKHELTGGTGTDGVVVEVHCIDDDGPGALISGQYVWPAAPFLARFVARHWGRHAILQLPSEARVLELGAGCGLVGLTVAQMDGCACVTMTDHDPGTLKLIEEGVARNRPRLRAACRAALLEWGDDAAVKALGGEKGFDFVLGSDLIYSDTVVRPLLATMAGVLRGRGGEPRFLICGSFALGKVILAEVEKVCAELKLARAPVDLQGEDAPDTVWMEVLTLVAG